MIRRQALTIHQESDMTSTFIIIAEMAFHRLIDDYGFRLVIQEPTFVRWECENVFVSCNYDAGRSFEVIVELGQTEAKPERPFNFGEFLRSQNVPQREWPSGYTALGDDTLQRLFDQLGKLLSDYGGPLLRNNVDAWSRLAELREQECQAFALQRELRYAREDATSAWEAKDFRRFIVRLGPFRDVLGKSELAKLEYANAQMDSSTDKSPDLGQDAPAATRDVFGESGFKSRRNEGPLAEES